MRLVLELRALLEGSQLVNHIVSLHSPAGFHARFSHSDRVVSHIHKYISLVNRDFDRYKAFKDGLIAKFIYELTVESVPNGDYIPWMCRYTLFRCFMLKGGNPRLKTPNVCSRMFATNLYVMRLGVIACAYMMMNGGHSDQALPMLTFVQSCHVINMISPWISYCRTMDVRSSEKETSYLAENGDIICNNATFRQTIYSQLIPLVRSSICDIFNVLFKTSEWRQFLDNSNRICVSTNEYLHSLLMTQLIPFSHTSNDILPYSLVTNGSMVTFI